MGRHAGKHHTPSRQTHSRAPAILACLLPALCGACSWVQALQDNFMTSFGNNRSQALNLPLTEVQVRMVYPDGTDTVDSAVSYMLEPHAYRPAYRDVSGESIAQRRFINNFGTDPVPISMAMERLMGHDAQVMLDRDRKLYGYRLKNPDEPGIVFAYLGIETSASADKTPAADPPPGTDFKSVPYPGDAAPGAETALQHTGLAHAEAENVSLPAENRNICRSIQFRNREMLSETVRKYFLDCGFEEVFWKLGEPGRYADYRLAQDIDVPLPERHLDLIELLRARFGVRTLINEDNSVEFHDENSTF